MKKVKKNFSIKIFLKKTQFVITRSDLTGKEFLIF
jgi:hypothetical protein